MAYNNPIQKKGSSCVQMKDHKGKPAGLMMEGSVAYQESDAQKVVNLETKKPGCRQSVSYGNVSI